MKEESRQKAINFLKLTKAEPLKVKGGTIEFARAHIDNIAELEQMSNDELVDEFMSYYCMVNIYGWFGICDLQMKHLCLMELDDRGLIPHVEKLVKKMKQENKKDGQDRSS